MVYQNPDDPIGATPVTRRILDIIERHCDELSTGWLNEINSDASTPTFVRYPDNEELFRHAQRIFGQLGQWINQDMTRADLQKYWTSAGEQRRLEGFPLSEIVQSMGLIRKHFWQRIESDGLLDTAADMYQAMDIHNRVTLYFDRVIYYLILGYEKS
jgi:hypothetical protein